MKNILAAFLFLFSSFIYANPTEELLAQYQLLQPYHDSIQEPMPKKECERSARRGSRSAKKCWIKIEYEHNPQYMINLLKKTEKQFNTSDPQFLSSDLGKEYSHLKSFVDIYNRMEDCRKSEAGNTDIRFMTERLEQGVSEATALSSCQSCHTKNSAQPSTLGWLSHIIPFLSVKEKPLKEDVFQDEVFFSALKKSIQSRVFMENRFRKESFEDPSLINRLIREFCQKKQKNVCSKKHESLLASLIQKAQEKIPDEEEPLSPLSNVVKTVNQRISKLNNILKRYNQERELLLEQQQKEKKEIPLHITSRPALHRIKIKYQTELKSLKDSVFREYHLALAQIHHAGAVLEDRILRTDAVHQASGFTQLEEMNSKLLGVQGFEETILTNTDKFPLLKPIENSTAQKALDESFERSTQSIQHLLAQNMGKTMDSQKYQMQMKQSSNETEKEKLTDKYRSNRMKDIEELLLLHPDIISRSLSQNPQNSSIICTAAKNISDDRRIKELLKNGITLAGVAGTVAVALVAPYLGIVGMPILLATTGVALTSSTVDYVLRKKGASEHRKLKEQILNAYLSETGDSKSIEDIRFEWRKALAEELHANWAIGFGLFDITRSGAAIRKTLLHTSRQVKRPAISQVTKNRVLLNNISQSRKREEALIALMGRHSDLEVRKFLKVTALFPPQKQIQILDELPHMAAHPTLNLAQLTSELKKRGVKSNLSDFLVSYTRCVSCKAKPGIKLEKGKQTPPSN